MTAKVRKRIKAVAGAIAAKTGAYRRAFRDRALVVLFHRVDDRLPGDHISVTVPEFRMWCRFIHDHFEVVPYDTILRDVAAGKDISLKAAITFDDGYRDNFVSAAPELQRQGLPATFFVASDFVSSDTVAPWDTELPFRPEWMTWDEVRELEAAGFEIGGHTMTHIDMGRTPTAETERELAGCRARYASELRQPVRHFSYPFGGRDEINDAARQAVIAADFESCASAYGGLITPGQDLFHIQRTPISPWHEGPFQLLAEIWQEAVRPNHHPDNSLGR